MDYSFFVKQIGWMPKGMARRGAAIAAQEPQAEYSPNFRPRIGIASTHSSLAGAEAQAFALECAALVADIFPVEDLREFDLTTLEPGAVLGEHTDMTGAANKGWVVNVGHKVHFVLQALDSRSWHRRSLELEPAEFRYTAGGIYAFNNYVPHSVANPSSLPRIHLVLMYADPQWVIKRRLYARLDIKDAIF